MESSVPAISAKQQQVDKPVIFTLNIPLSILFVAVLLGFLQMAPYWRAQSQTPPGWTFTGTITSSPDMMQYRMWARQSQIDGVLISNKFTTEPNQPHLLVIFYYAIGQISWWTNVAPEFVYAYLGSIFAFALTILLFVISRVFLGSASQAGWVLAVLLLGGGLGGHLKFLSASGLASSNFIFHRIFAEPLSTIALFEDYRGNYIFKTLLDSHFSLLWLAATAAIFSLYWALKKYSAGRVALTAVLYAAVTLLHIYEGVTLAVIAVAIISLYWWKGLLNRSQIVTVAVCLVAAAVSIAGQILLYRASGLSLPTWRGENILFSVLLIAYPLAWGLLAWGLPNYWRKAGLNECFLLGWALGCTALTLAGPFFPYPDRGTMTLQIPLYIMAGAIYFSHFKRVTPVAALVAVLILGATPAWVLRHAWNQTRFDPAKPYMFMNTDHQALVNLLKERAAPNDILIVDKTDQPWTTADLWLAPEYPGKLYCGHFFLTEKYWRKCGELSDFYHRLSPQEQAAFLQAKNIHFVYVGPEDDLQRFERITGLILLKSTSAGSLFEYTSGLALESVGQ